jgi:GntR family transcriptional regulator/MocR family aminotransferase
MDQSLGIDLRPDQGPFYQQIFDQIVERIRNGAFSSGYRLPPSRSLADRLGVHRNTVVRAYEALEEGGFIESTVGRGTFVRASSLRPAPVAPASNAAAAGGGMPWASLLSRVSDAEPLTRFDRLARRTSGREGINLTRMQPPHDLLPVELFRRCMLHVLQSLDSKALGYSPREGVWRLREAIAADLIRQGVPARAEEILVTTGSQQALDVLARALVNPEEQVLVDASTYSGALNVFTAAGARLVGVPSDTEGPELAALERMSRSGAKALYLMPDAQNPSGLTIPTARRRSLIAWSRRSCIPLIEDAYVTDLWLDDAPQPVTLRSLDGEVLHLGSFSKKLIPALRVGYIVHPEGIGARLTSLKHTMDLGTSALLQHALAEFLDRGYMAPHLDRVRAEYRRRRDALVAALEKSLPKELSFHPPKAGLALFISLPDEISPAAAFEAAEREGVLVTPSTINAVSGHGGGGGIRLTFCGEPPRRIAEGARRLGRALDEILSARKGRAANMPALEVI